MSQPHAYALCFAEELPGPIIAFGHGDAIRPLFSVTGPFLFDNTNPYDVLETLGIIHSFIDEELTTRRAGYNFSHAIVHYLEQLQTYQSPILKPFLPLKTSLFT